MPAAFELELADGWTEVDPRKNAPELLVEMEQRLRRVRSDGSLIHDFGAVGPVDCPLAIDPEKGHAYRYVCESRLNRNDFSEIRRYDIGGGGSECVRPLGVNQWVLWMLEWLPAASGRTGCLMGLLASDLPVEEGIRIHHQLLLLDAVEWRLRTRLLCRDAYYPLAHDAGRREMIFAGAEGIHRVGMRGERLGSLTGTVRPGGRGAAFDPSGAPRAAVGGAGLFMWNLKSGSLRRLTRLGQFPLWSDSSESLWYSESSSNLCRYDLQEDGNETVLAVARDRHPETSFARPPQLSGCGRYLALPLTSRRVAGVASSTVDGKRERRYAFDHAFCILDLEMREVWRFEGFVSSFRWIGKTE